MTPLDHLLRLWGIDTLVICGTLANICSTHTTLLIQQREWAVLGSNQ